MEAVDRVRVRRTIQAGQTAELESFPRRQAIWVGLNCSAAVGLLILHFAFAPFHPIYSPGVIGLLSVGAVVAMVDGLVALVVWLIADALRREAAMLKQSLAVLEQTQAQLAVNARLAIMGEFASSIAHEIRNPVAMISSSLDLAAREDSPEDVRREMSRIARDEAMRLANLTGDFLAYARSKPPERQAVDLEGGLGYVAGLVRS